MTQIVTVPAGNQGCKFFGNFAQVVVKGELCRVKRDVSSMYVLVGWRKNMPRGYETREPYFITNAVVDAENRLVSIEFNLSRDILNQNWICASGVDFESPPQEY